MWRTWKKSLASYCTMLIAVLLMFGPLLLTVANLWRYDHPNTITVAGFGLTVISVTVGLMGTAFREDQKTLTPVGKWAGISAYVGTLVALTSTFVFTAGIREKGWVVNDRTAPPSSWLLGIPFYDDIVGFQLKREVSFKAIATTKDSKSVEAQLNAHMSLRADESTLMNLTKYVAYSEPEIIPALKEHLQEKFQQVIGEYDLAELPTSLVQEWQTANQVNRSFLTGLGLRWETLTIQDLHVHLADQ